MFKVRVVVGGVLLLAVVVSSKVPAAERASPSRPEPARPPATAPAAKRPSTYVEFYRDVLEFNRRTLVESYKTHGKREPQWNAKALTYLEAAA